MLICVDDVLSLELLFIKTPSLVNYKLLLSQIQMILKKENLVTVN